MAFNIAVTSKYKPFTYEEMIKPLEGYWEKYDEQEEDLAKLKTDASAIKSYLDTLPKIEGPNGELVYTEADQQLVNQYNNYIKSIEDIGNQMASSGLNYDLKVKAKELPSMYNNQIAPIATAIDSRLKFINTLKQEEARGNYLNIDLNNLQLSEFIDGLSPEYKILDKSAFGNYIMAAATAATSNSKAVKKGNTYEVGIQPTAYLKGELNEEQKQVTDRLEQDALQYYLDSLNLSADALSSKQLTELNNFIKQNVALGLRYSQQNIPRGGGGGGGRTGGGPQATNYRVFYWPRTTSTTSADGKLHGESIITTVNSPLTTVFDSDYNHKVAELKQQYPDYDIPIANSSKVTSNETINLYEEYNQTSLLSKGTVSWIPITGYKDNTKHVLGYIAVQGGSDTNRGEVTTRKTVTND